MVRCSSGPESLTMAFYSFFENAHYFLVSGQGQLHSVFLCGLLLPSFDLLRGWLFEVVGLCTAAVLQCMQLQVQLSSTMVSQAICVIFLMSLIDWLQLCVTNKTYMRTHLLRLQRNKKLKVGFSCLERRIPQMSVVFSGIFTVGISKFNDVISSAVEEYSSLCAWLSSL